MLKTLIAAVGILAALTAHGQTYPNKPVRMIVAFPPGQTTDIIARAIATRFAETMKQNFITDNKPGAGAIIGTELAKNAAPDGYTLLMNSSGPMAINPGLYAKLPYDPVRDFVSIGMTANVPQFVVARTDFPANTLKELGAVMSRLEIVEFKGGIYYGKLYLKTEGGEEDKVVDCRPSDGIGLAIRMKTPIFVSEEVMASESFAVDPTKEEQDKQAFHDFIENISPKDFEQYGKGHK